MLFFVSIGVGVGATGRTGPQCFQLNDAKGSRECPDDDFIMSRIEKEKELQSSSSLDKPSLLSIPRAL